MKQKKRFKRLLYPYLLWPVFLFGVENVIRFFTHAPLFHLKDLLFQILFGTRFIEPMWYLLVLILISIFWSVFYRLIPEQSLEMGIWVLFFAGIWLQYSELNVLFFGSHLSEFKLILSYGRIVEMLPFSCIGLLCSKHRNNLVFEHKLQGSFICMAAICLIMKYNVFDPELSHTGYGGVYYIAVSFLLYWLFYNLPASLFPDILKKIIVKLSSYTLGIFCIHLTLGWYLYHLFQKFHLEGTIFFCFCVYFGSFFLCVFLCRILPGIFIKLCK